MPSIFAAPRVAIVVALLITTCVAIIAALNPQLARIGVSRWFSSAPLDWPRITRVAFAWDTPDGCAPRVLPIGEQLLVRAKVNQGGYPTQRVWLTTWSDNHPSTDDLMTFQSGMSSANNFIYERTLDPQGDKSFSLKLAAGDDHEQEPVSIRLAPRPVISEMFASITPPAYVKNTADPSKPAPPVVVELLTQSARAVEGAAISIRIKSTKPFLTDSRGEPEIRLLDQNKDEEIPVAATRTLLSPDVAQLAFAAAKTIQARVAIRDSDGFENRVGGALSIEVVPDSLPSVVITEPRRSVERSPDANVELSIQATDDLGLDGLQLVAEKFDAKPGDPPLFQQPLPWTDRTVDTASGNTTGLANHTWNLTALNLQPGARLTFYAMVQDNYEVAGKRHPWVKSQPLTLQIRSAAEIADAARKRLNEIKERIKILKTQQEQTRSQTEVIQKAAAATGITTAQQKSQLGDLAQQESEQAAAANAVQQSVEQVGTDLKQNKMSDTELGKLASDVSAGMKDVAQNNMPAAAADLNKSHDAAGNSDKRDDQSKAQAQEAAKAAADAGGQQSEAIAKMNAMIDQLGAAGDFEAIRNELEKIRTKQDALDAQTRELATKTIGKRPDDLPQETRDKLNDVAGQQSALANQTNDLIAKMDKASNQLAQTDPASSTSLQKASETGKSDQVTPSQSGAGSSISQNQMSSAANSQNQAKVGLQAMSDELNKNEERQLEQLSRDLQELIDLVKQLRQSEGTLATDTTAAGDKAPATAMTKLGDVQGQLQMNTIVVQKKAESTKNAQAAAVDIHEAADHMSESAAALYGSHQPAALDPEKNALASLDAAIKKLEQQKADVDDKIKDKDLAYFIKQYEEIVAEQKAEKATSDAVDSRRQAAADKQVDRLGLIQLAKLATGQGSLADRVASLSADDKLKDFSVVLWMNTIIRESMLASRDNLKKAQTGLALASAQQNSIDRLQDIIDALKEEKAKQSDFKKDQPPGGGGGGGGQKPPLVPPLAQLKLLRAMQVVINGQTASVAKNIDNAPDDGTRTQLQSEASRLGKQQGEIKNIATDIIKKLK